MADMKGSTSNDTEIHALHKEWNEAFCPICMDHPHNAVLLLCSSHTKGCKCYICDTSYRHSNCLDQFKKTRYNIRDSSSQPSSSLSRNPASSSLLQAPPHVHTSEPNLSSRMRYDLSDAHESYSSSENNNGISTELWEALGEIYNAEPSRSLQMGSEGSPETGVPGSFSERNDLEELSTVNLLEPYLNLKCPLCRGTVQGLKIVKEAREYLDLKQRSCSQESCSFFGNYRELRRHARRVHPTTRPVDVDASRQCAWQHFVHQREYGDIVSAIHSAMPGAIVLGDYVIDNGDGLSDDREGSSPDEGSDLWWSSSFLFQMIRPIGPVPEPRELSWTMTRHPRSSGALYGRHNLWDDEDDLSNDMDEDVHPIRRRRFTRFRPVDAQP